MEEVKKAQLYESTNQPFRTYVIEGFKATAVEPRLDQVFYEVSPKNYLNIEVYSQDTSLDQVKANVLEDDVYVKYIIYTVEEWESIIPFLVMMRNTGLQEQGVEK